MFYWLVISLFFTVQSQNVFIAEKQNNFVCITNSTYGLSWVPTSLEASPNWNPFPKTNQPILHNVSIYIPQQSENLFDCSITEDSRTKKYFLKKPWSLKNSLHSETGNKIILDRRWEEFITHTTKFVDGERLLRFLRVVSNLGHSFDIPFSLRIKYEAHIFLCDGPYPPESNCYWFILNGLRGKTSGIRKCGKGEIPNRTEKYPQSPCQDLIDAKYFSTGYVEEQLWSHFKLTKLGDHIFLRDQYNKTVLELHDDMFEINEIIIHSKFTEGFWKIHEVDYIYTDQEVIDTPLGPPITTNNTENPLCISMFFLMCNLCKLNLKLQSGNVTLREETFTQNNQDRWMEIKFFVDKISNFHFQNLQLYVSTVGNNSERFWAIDKVRLCQKLEYRYINASMEVPCQEINTPRVVSFENNTLEEFSSDCSEDKIGTFCIPCRWIFEDCNKIKICTETTCWCSAGFRNVISHCEDYCEPFYYGYGCKPCGKCYDLNHNPCNIITGTCTSCIDHYVGPKCDRLSVTSPHDLNITWSLRNDMIVKWKQPDEIESKMDKFQVLVTRSNNISNQISSTIDASEKSTYCYKVNASSLVPSNKYFVRVVADNQYSQNEVNATTISPPEIPYLVGEPKLVCYATTFTIEVQLKGTETYNLTVLVSDNSGVEYGHSELNLNGLEILNLKNFRSMKVFWVCQGTCTLVLGNDGVGTRNSPLIPKTAYNIILIVSKTRLEKTSYHTYLLSCTTSERNMDLLGLLGLLVIPIIGLVIFLKWKKIKSMFENWKSNSSLRQITEDTTHDTQSEVLIEMEPIQSNLLSKRSNSREHRTINTYTYLNPIQPSKVVPVKEFQKYVNESEKNRELDRQFKVTTSNKKIYDYVEGNFFFHYFDMVYVNGSVSSRVYVVAEVPKLNRIKNFWKKMFEENVKMIVLLSGQNNEEFVQYWPAENEKLRCDDTCSIELASKQTGTFYEQRVFTLIHENGNKQIEQIIFSHKGSDVKHYIPFFKKLLNYSLNSASPMLIHSSDSSKIGFVLLCDMSLRMATEEGVVDVLSNLTRITNQVSYLIDDPQVYKMSHFVIAEYIFGAELADSLAQIYNSLKEKNKPSQDPLN